MLIAFCFLAPGASRKTDEFEWTSSELLSGLRSIEWDLQVARKALCEAAGPIRAYVPCYHFGLTCGAKR